MIVCPSCGTKIRFCLACGYPLPKARTESLEELSLKIKHLLTCESCGEIISHCFKCGYLFLKEEIIEKKEEFLKS
jgi:ribosomal protein L32